MTVCQDEGSIFCKLHETKIRREGIKFLDDFGHGHFADQVEAEYADLCDNFLIATRVATESCHTHPAQDVLRAYLGNDVSAQLHHFAAKVDGEINGFIQRKLDEVIQRWVGIVVGHYIVALLVYLASVLITPRAPILPEKLSFLVLHDIIGLFVPSRVRSIERYICQQFHELGTFHGLDQAIFQNWSVSTRIGLNVSAVELFQPDTIARVLEPIHSFICEGTASNAVPPKQVSELCAKVDISKLLSCVKGVENDVATRNWRAEIEEFHLWVQDNPNHVGPRIHPFTSVNSPSSFLPTVPMSNAISGDQVHEERELFSSHSASDFPTANRAASIRAKKNKRE